MSDIIDIRMKDQRDIQTVTAEIRTLMVQSQRLVLEYAIEVGRRLTEAKSMLPHGRWGEWLRDEVEFSQSTANNLMKIFEEYGDRQLTIFGAVANSQALGNLTYTKALKLLSVPGEEREEFVKENNVEKISTRELDKLIAERDKAKKEKDEKEKELSEAQKACDAAMKKAAEARAELEKARVEKDRMKEKLEQEQKNSAAEKSEAARIQKEAEARALKEAEKKVAKRLQDAEQEKQEAERRLRTALRQAEEAAQEAQRAKKLSSPELVEFKAQFSRVQEEFNKLQGLLEKVKLKEPEKAEKLEAAVSAMVKGMMMHEKLTCSERITVGGRKEKDGG